MKRIYLICILGLAQGCGNSFTNKPAEEVTPGGTASIVSKPEGPYSHLSTASDHEAAQKMTLKVGGHEVDAIFEDLTIKKVITPEQIHATLKIRNFERMLAIYDIERIKEICAEMDYRRQGMNLMTFLKGSIQIFPFTELNIKTAFARTMQRPDVTVVPNLVQPKNVRVEISAPYFKEPELTRLQNWLNTQIRVGEEHLKFELLRDLNRLDDPDPLKPIMELGRLICGILSGDATLRFIMTDEEGTVLTTIVSSVEF